MVEKERNVDIAPKTQIEENPTDWIWPARIPRGKVTLLSGMPRLGKHGFCCWLAAQVSAGKNWPETDLLKEYKQAAIGTVVLITSPEKTARVTKGSYRPQRLADKVTMQGGQAGNIFILHRERFSEDEAFDVLKNADELNNTLEGMPDCRLLILDPLDAFVDNLEDEAVAGQVYKALSQIAKERNIAVVVTDKFSQTQQDKVDATDFSKPGRKSETLGSRAFMDISKNVLEITAKRAGRIILKQRILHFVKSDYCPIEPQDLKFSTPEGVVKFGGYKQNEPPQPTGKGESLMTGKQAAKAKPESQSPADAVKDTPEVEPEPKSPTALENSEPEPQENIPRKLSRDSQGAIPTIAQQKAIIAKTEPEAIEHSHRTPTEPQTEPVPVNGCQVAGE